MRYFYNILLSIRDDGRGEMYPNEPPPVAYLTVYFSLFYRFFQDSYASPHLPIPAPKEIEFNVLILFWIELRLGYPLITLCLPATDLKQYRLYSIVRTYFVRR